MKKPTSDETKTYVMTLASGSLRRITVPAHWKVTFGPLVPPRDQSGESQSRFSGKWFALRFYEGKDQQRAVFTDVVAFRDESLRVEERVTKTRHHVAHKQAPGGQRQVVMQASVTEWRDPLAPDDGGDQEFLQLEEEKG